MNCRLSIDYVGDAQRPKAEQLALAVNLPIIKGKEPCLLLSECCLSLKMVDFLPIHADFSKSLWRKRKSEGKKQGLVRACKPMQGMSIIDATAGWGRDAAVLASFGAKVLMIERHPILHALLADALSRQTAEDKEGLSLNLKGANAFDFLHHLEESHFPDLIYIDPMHPERQKSSLVKKELQALQQLIKPDEDALALIELAVCRAKKRVVVKWPQKAAALRTPTYSIEGKTVRFDVYTP